MALAPFIEREKATSGTGSLSAWCGSQPGAPDGSGGGAAFWCAGDDAAAQLAGCFFYLF